MLFDSDTGLQLTGIPLSCLRFGGKQMVSFCTWCDHTCSSKIGQETGFSGARIIHNELKYKHCVDLGTKPDTSESRNDVSVRRVKNSCDKVRSQIEIPPRTYSRGLRTIKLDMLIKKSVEHRTRPYIKLNKFLCRKQTYCHQLIFHSSS